MVNRIHLENRDGRCNKEVQTIHLRSGPTAIAFSKKIDSSLLLLGCSRFHVEHAQQSLHLLVGWATYPQKMFVNYTVAESSSYFGRPNNHQHSPTVIYDPIGQAMAKPFSQVVQAVQLRIYT